MSRFTYDQEKTFKRLCVMKECVAEQTLHETPCPLLESELNELSVFAEKLLALARDLQKSMEGE